MATIAGRIAAVERDNTNPKVTDLVDDRRWKDLQRLREAYREYQNAGVRDIERLEQQLAQRDRMLADLLGTRVIPLTTVEVVTKRQLALGGLPE